MTQLRNNFQGLASGTTLTTGNSGGASGDAFDVVVAPPTGGTLAASNTAPLMHAPVYMVVQTTTTAGNPTFQWSTSMGTQTQIWGRVYFNAGALPAGNNRIINFMSGATQCCSIALMTTGQLSLRDAASVDTTTTATLSVNTWYRIEFRFQFSTTTGNASLSLYASPDSTTATETISTTNQNYGAANATLYQFGQIGSSTTRGPWRFADVAIDNTAAIGPTLIMPDVAQARYIR